MYICSSLPSKRKYNIREVKEEEKSRGRIEGDWDSNRARFEESWCSWRSMRVWRE